MYEIIRSMMILQGKYFHSIVLLVTLLGKDEKDCQARQFASAPK
jgi:hypothetical protein